MGDAFRRAAAQINGVEPDNIMCCNGGDDLLTIAMRAFCDEQRPVAFAEPTYSLYGVLARIQNCPVVDLAYDHDFGLPPDMGRTGAALTIVCNPNAPSGSFVDAKELLDLANELRGTGILLVDEAYADFAKGNCIELVARCENVVILKSMSKGYSLAGLRFGYAIAPKEIIDGLVKVKDSYNVDALAQAAATAAIKDQEYLRENVAKVQSERQRMTDELTTLGFQVRPSQTNFVLAKCREPSARDLYDKLVERDIYVRYFNLPRLTDKLRITVGTKDQNDKLIEALKDILAKPE